MFDQTQYTQYFTKVIGYTQYPFIYQLYRSFRSYHSISRQNEAAGKVTPSSASIQNHIIKKQNRQRKTIHTIF